MSHIPDELVTFVEVLNEDEDLRAWFESFADVSDGQREMEFCRLAARMHAAGEAPELIAATALLANPEIYRAAVLTLGPARAPR